MLKLLVGLLCAVSVASLEKYVTKFSQHDAMANPARPGEGQIVNYIKGFNNQDAMYDGPRFPQPEPAKPYYEVSNSLQEPFSSQELKDGMQRHENELTFVRQRTIKKCADCANKPVNEEERPNQKKYQ